VVERRPRWLFLRPADIHRASRSFDRHGGWAVFVCQLMPGIRGLIAIPAGLARMNLVAFVLANLAGTLVWCVVLAYLGRMLRSHFTRIHDVLGPIGWGLLALAVVAGVMWAV